MFNKLFGASKKTPAAAPAGAAVASHVPPEDVAPDATLRVMPVPAPPLNSASLRSKNSSSAVMASAVAKMRFAYGFAFLTLFAALGWGYAIVAKLSQTKYGFGVDTSGTYHWGPLDRLGAESPVFTTAALLASQAAFQRSVIQAAEGDTSGNRADFDLPELVRGMFRADALAKLNADLKRQSPDIAARRISQKIEISRIRGLSERQGTRLVQVRGSLIRTGSFDGNPISEAVPISCVFAIRENPRLDQKGQFPFIVTDFLIRADEDASTVPSGDGTPAAVPNLIPPTTVSPTPAASPAP